MRCGNCGSQIIALRNAKGRGFPYMEYDNVILTVDIDLHTCLECGNIVLLSSDCIKLDNAIEKTLKREKR